MKEPLTGRPLWQALYESGFEVPIDSDPSAGEPVIRPFRRKPRQQQLRRSRALASLRRALSAILIYLVLPAAGLAAFLASPLFSLRSVEIKVGDRVERAQVEAAMDPLRGRNVLRLHLPEVQEKIAALSPWIEGVELHKKLPGSLRVEIQERRSAALLRRESEYFYLDSKGSVITRAAAPQEGAPEYKIISLAREDESPRTGLEMLDEIRRVHPDWWSDLSEVRVLAEDEVEILSTGLPGRLRVRSGSLEARSRHLEDLLPVLGRTDSLAAIDLRFPRRIVLEPRGSAAGGR